MSADYYAILGVASDATQKEISKAFRAKARVIHPDKQPPGASEAAKNKAKKAFQELALAYEVLGDETKRAEYNLSRPVPGSGGGGGRSGAQRPAGARGRGRAHEEDEEAEGGYRYQYDDDEEYGDYSKSASYRQGRRGGEKYGVPRDKPASRPPTSNEDYARDRAAEERERERRHGLGGHWVKPPTATAAQKSQWTGWKKSGDAGGAPTKKKQSGERGGDDSDSDVSSVLSFNIGIDLRDLDLKDLEVVNDDGADMGGWEGGEVWTFPQQEEADKQAEGAQAQEKSGKAETSRAAAKPGKGTKQAQARPCCATQ